MRAFMIAHTFYEPDNRVRLHAETLVKRQDDIDVIVLNKTGRTSRESFIKSVFGESKKEYQQSQSGHSCALTDMPTINGDHTSLFELG